MVERLRTDFGEPALDIVVHSLANGPEVKKPLMDTSAQGYLAAVSVSAYSNISLVREPRAADADRAARSSRSPTWPASG